MNGLFPKNFQMPDSRRPISRFLARLVARLAGGGLPRPVFALTRALGFFSSERIFSNIPRNPTPLQ